ncbi:helix-turn-helix transcriptional regulator [Pseudomonas lactucae]|uniref:AlpA family phage regulatory protein n=1 Tax=Pseudomonas lactucae TaxID=2813360 RepID=A0A9X0Y8V1_9PSED|nr:AlpA family phage regulatory protein [Pseudomonas lactucae]MBN2974702.1 AlpA family phage regulatory protein [Pseudomonas lactucae]MBN2987312.1 AlpA family phage regulatory protein [Pseudomonas lactucae]
MANATDQIPHRKFIKLNQVKELSSLSTSEIYRRISVGKFPKQVSLGPKCVVWIEAEIFSWLDACVVDSRGEAA